MYKELNEAYRKLFNKDPENLKDWEIAKILMENWNVPVIGEDLAKWVIFKVVNHVQFPSNEINIEVVLKAENYATELFDDNEVSDEPHMAELAILERRYEIDMEKKKIIEGSKLL